MAGGARSEDPSHRSGKSVAERVRGELQRGVATGVFEPGAVLRCAGSTDQNGAVAAKVQ